MQALRPSTNAQRKYRVIAAIHQLNKRSGFLSSVHVAIINRRNVSNEIFRVQFVVYLTFTDPLRIQSWSHDIRNQTKPNQTGNTVGEKKQGNQIEGHARESSYQRTSSPGKGTQKRQILNKIRKHKLNQKKTNKIQPHNTRKQEKHAPQQATQERQLYKQRKKPQTGRQDKDNECDTQRKKNA